MSGFRKRLPTVGPCSPLHRAICPYGPRRSGRDGLHTGRSISHGWRGHNGPISPDVAVLRVAAGAILRQACTAAGIDSDPPVVGIPAAALAE
jgi:hypothetical protein